MKKGEIHNKLNLSRRIFLYLLGVAFLSVISIGFFWIERKLSDYHNELKFLKKTFSETKKLEIKNKILQIKDYIQWIQNMPPEIISQTLASQTDQLELPVEKIKSVSGYFPGLLTQAVKDSICKSRVPVYILNDYGKILYSFDPFQKTENKKLNEKETIVLHQILKRNTDKDIELIYKTIGPNDSTLEAVAYYDNGILPGFKVVSMVSAENFENVLQVFILDTISKLRYAENEYIFVNSFFGKALVTNGKYNTSPVDILTSGDTSWIKIFKVQQSAASQSGGVFHTYTWQKLSSSSTSTKTSYFSYYPKWKWIIGTGFYEDDVNSVIVLKRKALYADLQKNMLIITCYLLISSFLCYLLAMFFSKKLGKNIELFKNFFEKAASENLLINKLQVSFREFENMAEAANHMVEERKHAEEEIHNLNINLEKIVEERTAQLEATNQELESFSYSISHDLRAPLRAIYGFSQILSSRHRKSLNDEGRQYMDYIVEASICMEQLINDLLNYSRLGRKSLDLHVVSLTAIVDSLHLIFKQQLKDIDAKIIIDQELPQIIGDETLLHQIFTNLIGNAIKFRRKDVPLIINISCKRVTKGYILKITDNGIGIPKEYWDKIFNVFQRLHSEDKYPGTGIGLASVKKAVSMLGGTIWVDSVVGEGSTFSIKLPEHKI